MKIYKTVSVGKKGGTFDKEVNELLAQGWELYGNPYALEDLQCQALTKQEANPVKGADVIKELVRRKGIVPHR